MSSWANKALGLLLLATGCPIDSGECLGGGPTTTFQLILSAPLSALAPLSLTPDSGCFWLCDAIDGSYTGDVLAAEEGACACTFDDPMMPVTLLADGGYEWTDGGPAFSCSTPPSWDPSHSPPVNEGAQYALRGYDGGNCESAILTSFLPIWAKEFTDIDGGSICAIAPGSGAGPAVVCNWPAINQANSPTCDFPTLPDAGPSVVCTWPASTHCASSF